MVEPKKEWFREHVKERVQKELKQNIGDLDDIRKSHWMTKVYIEEVASVLFPGALPEDTEDLESSYVDASRDAGVDFISRNEGTVLIIQAKYRGQDASEKPSELDHFAEVLSRLHPVTGRSVPKNRALREVLSDIDWDNDRFELHFLTLGKINDTMRSRESAGQRPVKEVPGLEERVDLFLLDELSLNDRLRDALTALSGIRVPVDIIFSPTSDEKSPRWITYETDEGKRAWVGLVSAKNLCSLKTHRSRLFALNIRNYIGDNAKNIQIRQTAIDDPHNFFFYNNGISAVATKVSALGNGQGLRCDEFSIINGAQTFKSLIKAQEKNSKSAGDASVLMRVTEVSLRKKSDDVAFIDKVTQYNNTQNAIFVSDFRSNDGVQRALKKRFAELSRKGGKTYNYKNKRTDERPRNTIPIGMEEFAQTVYAFRHGPIDAKGGKQFLFDSGPRGGYMKLFGTNGQLWDTVTDEDFHRMAGEWFLCSQARELMDGIRREAMGKAPEDLKPVIKAALERRWMLYYTLGEFLREKYEKEQRDLLASLRRLGKPKWMDEPEDKGDMASLKKYCNATKEILIRCYRNAMKTPSFVQRNWYRSDDTLRDIREEILLADSLLEAMPLFKGAT